MKKNNNKAVLISLIATVLLGVESDAATKGKLSLDILISGGNTKVSWDARATFYNGTILANANSTASKDDVSYAKENMSKVGIPFKAKDPVIDKTFGTPYFVGTQIDGAIFLEGHPPALMSNAQLNSLTYTYYFYKDALGTEEADSPMIGKDVLWETEKKGIADGLYYIKLVISNDSGSVSSDISPVLLNVNPPEILPYSVEVDEKTDAHPILSQPLLADYTYTWSIYDFNGNFLEESAVENVKSNKDSSSTKFSMLKYPVGTYKMNVEINDTKYTTVTPMVDFEYKNFPPLNFDWITKIDGISTADTVSLSSSKTNTFKIGERITGQMVALPKDPEGAVVEFGIIVKDSTGTIVLKTIEQDGKKMYLHTYDLTPGVYNVSDYVFDGAYEVLSPSTFKINLESEKPLAPVLSAITATPSTYVFSVERNREIENEGFLYDIQLIDSKGNIVSSTNNSLTVNLNDLAIGKNYSVKAITRLKNHPEIFSEACVHTMDGVVVDKCDLNGLNPYSNLPPSFPEFNAGFTINVNDGVASGTIDFATTKESIDPEGLLVRYSYNLYQNGELKYSFASGKDINIPLSGVDPGFYDVVEFANDGRFFVNSALQTNQGSDPVYNLATGEGAIRIEVPDLKLLNSPSFIYSRMVSNYGKLSLIPVPTLGIDFAQPITISYDFYSSNGSLFTTLSTTQLAPVDFDEMPIPDDVYTVVQRLRNIGHTEVVGATKTINITDISPKRIKELYEEKNEKIITFDSKDADKVLDPDMRFEYTKILIKDMTGNLLKELNSKTISNSRILPINWDSSELPDGDYKFSAIVFDGKMFGPESDEVNFSYNNVEPIAPTPIMSYNDKGVMTTGLAVQQQSSVITSYSYSQNLVCNNVNTTFNDEQSHTINMASARTGLCTLIGSIKSPGYLRSNQATYSFVNIAPTMPEASFNYKPDTLTLDVSMITASIDKENGAIKYELTITDKDGKVAKTLEIAPTGINTIDVDDLVNGVYNLELIAIDEAGNKSLAYVPPSFTMNVMNLAPIKPTTIVYLDDVYLNVQTIGSADPENKALSYNIELKNNQGVAEIASTSNSNINKLDLTKIKTGNYTLVSYVSDSVNKVYADNVPVYFVNEAPAIINPAIAVSRNLNIYTFDTEDNIVDDHTYPPLSYSWEIYDDNKPIYKETTDKPVLKWAYNQLSFSVGNKYVKVTVDDGINKATTDVVTFFYGNMPPEKALITLNQTGLNLSGTVNNSIDTIDGDSLLFDWMIKDKNGNIIRQKNGVQEINEFLNIPSTELYITVETKDMVNPPVLSDLFKFNFTNVPPTKPIISLLDKVKTITSYSVQALTDTEKESVTIKWNLYDINEQIIKEAFSSSLVAKIDDMDYPTGTYYLEAVSSDGENFVNSEKTSVVIFNEAPGVPVFNAIQKDLSFNFFGKPFYDLNGGVINYTYNLYDLNHTLVAATTGDNTDQTIGMAAKPDGKYYAELVLKDPAGQTSQSPLVLLNYKNSAPSDPDFIVTQTNYSVSLYGYTSTDNESQPVTYRYDIFNGGDRTTPIKTVNGKKGSFVPRDIGDGVFDIVYLANDGVNDNENPKVKTITLNNTAPTKPDLTITSSPSSVVIESSNSTDINKDDISYEVKVIRIDNGKFIYASPSDLQGTGSTSSVLNSNLFGNGNYKVEVIAKDWSKTSLVSTGYFTLNWEPKITGVTLNIENFFTGMTLEPGQTVKVDSLITGNTNMSAVTYNWSTTGDGLLSTLSGTLLTSPSVNWTVPTLPGVQTLTLSAKDSETQYPVVQTISVTVQDYPPTVDSFTIQDPFNNVN